MSRQSSSLRSGSSSRLMSLSSHVQGDQEDQGEAQFSPSEGGDEHQLTNSGRKIMQAEGFDEMTEDDAEDDEVCNETKAGSIDAFARANGAQAYRGARLWLDLLFASVRAMPVTEGPASTSNWLRLPV